MSRSPVTRFEGTYLGDATRIGPATRLECKVCWYVYDPAAGDPHWQIPPGTPFAELPAHWTCPNCAGEKEQFMVVGDD
ncbi:MAG: rubredoxin [Burkholderiales bacterium]|nr:rubredoxin [Burkholderiales bacterium]